MPTYRYSALRLFLILVMSCQALFADEPAPGNSESAGEIDELQQILREMRSPVKTVRADITLDGKSPLGDEAAELILVEFEDYQCGFCRRHHLTTEPRLKEAFVDTGILRLVSYDFPVAGKHADAPKIAEGLRCAGEQGRYWEMRHRLLSQRTSGDTSDLSSHAQALGLEVEDFRSCLTEGRYADAVSRDLATGRRLGVRGTPTFFIGRSDGVEGRVRLVRRIDGTQSFDVFRNEIDNLRMRLGMSLPGETPEGGAPDRH